MTNPQPNPEAIPLIPANRSDAGESLLIQTEPTAPTKPEAERRYISTPEEFAGLSPERKAKAFELVEKYEDKGQWINGGRRPRQPGIPFKVVHDLGRPAWTNTEDACGEAHLCLTYAAAEYDGPPNSDPRPFLYTRTRQKLIDKFRGTDENFS